jgi:GntR family transcriptional regulator, transcriptional repressor for pyruvate dehydrogenase complex
MDIQSKRRGRDMWPASLRQGFNPESLSEHVTKTLQEEILGGKYLPGIQLPSGKELGQQFGVSITVIREALSRLKAEGLIASRQGKGVFVSQDHKARPFRLGITNITHQALSDVIELRIGVEVEAAGLAAERRVTSDLNIMAVCLKAMKPASKPSNDALSADVEFHRAIAMATRNQMIISFIDFLEPMLRETIALARAKSSQRTGFELASFQEHHKIYEAIKEKAKERAKAAMRSNLEGGLRRLLSPDR